MYDQPDRGALCRILKNVAVRQSVPISLRHPVYKLSIFVNGQLRLLCRFLFYELFSGCNDNSHTQDHQKNGDDQLESFHHEDTGSGAESTDQGDEALHQCRKGYNQHDDQAAGTEYGSHVLVTFRNTHSVISTRALNSWLALPNSGQMLAYPTLRQDISAIAG